MAPELTVIRAADGDWHRTDILGCQRSSVIDPAEEREADPENLNGDRCEYCTW